MNKYSLLLLLVLFFTSCTKDEVVQKNEPNESSNTYLFNPQPSTDQSVKDRINDFRARLAATASGDASYRSADLTVEEAKWNIEANLNATYGRADVSFSKMDKSLSTFVVPVSNGVISNEDVLAAYETARTKLSERYSAIQSSFKQVLVLDVYLEEVSETEAVFALRKYIASAPGAAAAATLECQIHEDPVTDAWYAISGFGNCPGDVDLDGLDAADIFEQELNARIELPLNHIYFVDVEGIGFSPWWPNEFINPLYDTPLDSYRDYLVWYSASSQLNQQICLPPDEMNFYFCNLVHDIIPSIRPAGKSFSHADMTDEGIFNVQWWHEGTIFFGTSFQCECPPCDPSTPPSECPICC